MVHSESLKCFQTAWLSNLLTDQMIQLSKSTWTESHNAHKSSQMYPGSDISKEREKELGRKSNLKLRNLTLVEHTRTISENESMRTRSKEIKPPEMWKDSYDWVHILYWDTHMSWTRIIVCGLSIVIIIFLSPALANTVCNLYFIRFPFILSQEWSLTLKIYLLCVHRPPRYKLSIMCVKFNVYQLMLTCMYMCVM